MFNKPQTPATFPEYFEKLDEKKYTDAELRAFGQELEPYRISKTLSTGEQVSYVSITDYLKAQKAISPEGAIYIKAIDYTTADGKENWKYDSHSNKYRVIMNKYRQWLDYIGRVEYAKKKEIEELAATAGF